jgi:phosphohistidine phosphatase SixA
MTDPLTRLRRQPMLAPLLLPLVVVIAAGLGIAWLGTWASTTTIILVRHAETANPEIGDPELGSAGEARAALLGPFLSDALPGRQVDHLYSADTRRAQQTAASVANQFKLPINLIAGSDWPGLASRLRREHRGETVVVVGYASTLPSVARQLGVERLRYEEADFGSIQVIVVPSPGQPQVVRLRYGAPPRPAKEPTKSQ